MATNAPYTRSWSEIEWMLAEAQEQMLEQKMKFHNRKQYVTRRVVEEQPQNLLGQKGWPMY